MTVQDVLFSQAGWWIQLLFTLFVFGLSFYNATLLFTGKSSQVNRANLNGVLVFGAATAVLGVALQLIGFVMALEAIIEAADISPQMVMGGLKISFYTTIYGFIVFVVSAVLWYALKLAWEKQDKE
jgi:hypothetical protein